MYSITREATFEYAHRLLDHKGKCRYIHGHSGKAIVTVFSESLDNEGMVLDFSVLKERMNSVLDEWDHAIILQKDDPLVPLLQTLDQRVFVLPGSPTAENLAHFLYFKLHTMGLNVESVTIYETEKNCATMRF